MSFQEPPSCEAMEAPNILCRAQVTSISYDTLPTPQPKEMEIVFHFQLERNHHGCSSSCSTSYIRSLVYHYIILNGLIPVGWTVQIEHYPGPFHAVLIFYVVNEIFSQSPGIFSSLYQKNDGGVQS